MMGSHSALTQVEFDASNLNSRLKLPIFQDGEAEDDCFWMIRLGANAPDGPLIGIVSLSQREGRPVDVGWALHEGYMNLGYATEAAREVVRWAQEVLRVEEMAVYPAETNEASNRVAKKLGFVEAGRIEHDKQPGKSRSVWLLKTAS